VLLPENLVNTISEKPIKEFHKIFVTNVFGFIDVLIKLGSKGQTSRSQQAMTRETSGIQ